VVVDLVLAEVLIEDEVEVEGTNGVVVPQVELCLVEVVILLLEVADLNIQRQATILDRNIIQVMIKYCSFVKTINEYLFDITEIRPCIRILIFQQEDQKDILVEVVVVIIRIAIKDLA